MAAVAPLLALRTYHGKKVRRSFVHEEYGTSWQRLYSYTDKYIIHTSSSYAIAHCRFHQQLRILPMQKAQESAKWVLPCGRIGAVERDTLQPKLNHLFPFIHNGGQLEQVI